MSDHLSQLGLRCLQCSMAMCRFPFVILFYYFFLFMTLCFTNSNSVMLMNRTTNVTLMQFSFIICRCRCLLVLHSRHAIKWIIIFCTSIFRKSFLLLSNRHAFACLIDQTSSCYFMIFVKHTHTPERSISRFIEPYTILDLCILPENKKKTHGYLFNIYDFVCVFRISSFCCCCCCSGGAILTQQYEIWSRIQKRNPSRWK